jgi:hypothetical protein
VSERTNGHSGGDERQRGAVVSENDPDPHEPDEGGGTSVLGGRRAPDAGDPTGGGKHGEIGDAPSITSDEPDDGSGYPVGGGSVEEEKNAPPVADPGPDA